ncbi:Uncharacterised protein [Legionella bozemanae]|uniref:Uncharacterized protein n=1 Tax=Legionella bozemanae TaxID=447 RepID=A0A0W0RIZ4_LEGBO|nr:hypothetical protein Lboz_2594 [Legionella bozemanae]STO34711.1 Uncharacterised protein [Legionella bozemanae]
MVILINKSEGSDVQGDAERKTGVYTQSHENLSTTSMKQSASSVAFGKKSNEHLE